MHKTHMDTVYVLASGSIWHAPGRRAWNINLIERTNPDWHDLFPTMQMREAKTPRSGSNVEMGPGQLRRRPGAAGLAQDDT